MAVAANSWPQLGQQLASAGTPAVVSGRQWSVEAGKQELVVVDKWPVAGS